jgi:capsular exopolysaccharide synthesis family protein
LNRISSDYAALERDVATDTALQQSVLKRIKELDLTKQIDNVPLSITESAADPKNPSGPNRIRLIFQGAVAALFVGIGLVRLLQTIDGSIRTVDEAEDRLQIPVLGAISIDAGSQGQTFPRLVMVDEAHGLTAEGFRSLRASTAMIGRAADIKVRLVTSALPGEGKSFCTLNYAASLAQLGQRVVLVDLDLRRPTIGKRLQMNPDDPGVSSFLLGQKSFAEIQHPTRVPGLTVIPAGPRIPNPAEQLAGSHTRELFEALTSAFDVVVVDTAPVNSVADTISLLPFAKIVLLVIRAAKTPERAVFRAISEMRRVGAQIDGLVLNQLPKRGGYGYYYYYYGRDGYSSAGVYGAPDKKG